MTLPYETIPYGYCYCGCGQKTSIATKTKSYRGQFSGKPLKFLPNHGSRKAYIAPCPVEEMIDGQPCFRVPLTQGFNALVDPDDYPRISQHKWYAKKQTNGYTYAVRHITTSPGKQETVFMHREVMNLSRKDHVFVDHINQERTLDNRKCNLRVASNQQNQYNQRKNIRNKTGFKGVHQRPDGYFRVDIRIGGKKRTIGRSHIAEEAARIYDRAALQHFGEFAHINFPRSEYL